MKRAMVSAARHCLQHVPDGPALADVRLALLVAASALPFDERRKLATRSGRRQVG